MSLLTHRYIQGSHAWARICILMYTFGLCFVAHGAEQASEPLDAEALFIKHCISCHTIDDGERVATDLKGITRRRTHDWLIGYIGNATTYLKSDPLAMDLLVQYEEMPMPDLHIEEAEIEIILEYIESFEDETILSKDAPEPRLGDQVEGPDEREGVWAPGLILLGLALVCGGALWALGQPKAGQVVLVAAAGLAYWSFGGRHEHVLIGNGNDQGYSPEQPIAFSHKLHAGDLNVSCLYCHHAAEKGPVAGVPAASTCMNCHKVVRRTTEQTEDSLEIAKIARAWESFATESPEPIEWIRVHDVADFVMFSHQPHVTNNIQCQECHGPVQTMDRIRQAADLSMNWCIECHQRDESVAPSHWKSRSGGPLDCAVCHN